jgi:hypothetical protein
VSDTTTVSYVSQLQRQLVQIALTHARDSGPHGYCSECESTWPCATYQLATAHARKRSDP